VPENPVFRGGKYRNTASKSSVDSAIGVISKRGIAGRF
jgi:hypothetical protein